MVDVCAQVKNCFNFMLDTTGSQTEHFREASDGKYEHLQGGSQQQEAKMLVLFLPQHLVNQSTVFFMLVWQVPAHDLEVEFYTEQSIERFSTTGQYTAKL